ncbi:MAG TPA: ATP-dependent DNA helicase UvrD2 [Acidimicrobiales bacterium]|nr:ATP-dependent DNA helicase UvrD2 [Acidimicrobiales bacterium]
MGSATAPPAPSELLAGLTPAQVEAVTTPGQPLCILAGAGSGKTRVLTRRIAWRVAEDQAEAGHVLALTFTRRAADELSSRLGALGVRDHVAAGTFHALAYGQLRRRWADRGQRPPALLDRKLRLLLPLMPRRSTPSEPGPADVASEIEWAQARMVSPAGYEAAVIAAGRTPPLPAATIASLYERYQQEKQRRALVDFDDLLLACAQALETDTSFATTQRWRFRHVFVDEFQDVNPLQFRLLEAWRGGRDDLCVVGDPRQAIYSWNGADPRYLTDFASRFPGATVVHLDENHRSSPQILAVANAVLDGTGARRLRPATADGPTPTITPYANEGEEARAVVRALRRRGGGGRWSDLAVLARTHAQLVAFEEALQAAAIPYRLRGAASFLDQPGVREAMVDLRRRPAGAPLSAAVPDLDAAAAEAGPERGADLLVLAAQAREFLVLDPTGPVGGFVAWLGARLAREEPRTSGQAVELATFHAAKGLEWPIVFVVGLEQGLLPIGHATTPEARAEERRLLYVAVTRAERELHCSWAERRTFGARTLPRAPSPWLAAVEDAIAGPGQAPARGEGWKGCVADGRARLRAGQGGRRAERAGDQADPAVLQALRSWRAATARLSGVPAFVVFHDTTLAAVAEARPQDRSSLLALPGMGPVKAERYGEALLAVVAAAATGSGR